MHLGHVHSFVWLLGIEDDIASSTVIELAPQVHVALPPRQHYR